MKKMKHNTILHANKNIDHSHSNMVIHRIQLKSLICILIFPDCLDRTGDQWNYSPLLFH